MIPLSSELFAYRHHAGSRAMLVVGHLCLTYVVLRGSVAVLAVMGVRPGSQARACADSVEMPAILLFFKPGTADAFKDLISFIPIGAVKHPKSGALHQGIGCHGASRCLGIIAWKFPMVHGLEEHMGLPVLILQKAIQTIFKK